MSGNDDGVFFKHGENFYEMFQTNREIFIIL